MTARFRYDTSGNWYKGALHIHTTRSDGSLPPHEAADLYKGFGFDFIALTDHWVVSRESAQPDEWPLLMIDGVELDGRDDDDTFFHVVALGDVPEIHSRMGLVRAMQLSREAGAFLIWAHPHWSGNQIRDGLKLPFDAVEVYNRACHIENNTGSGLVHWTGLLGEAPDLLVAATDDLHQRPGANGGWVMVNCTELTSQAVLAALRSGNAYASNGPAFESIELHQGVIRVRTSPVVAIRLLGPGWSHVSRYASPDPLTAAEFSVPEDWEYVRIDIEDDHGRCAWTNTLFTDA